MRDLVSSRVCREVVWWDFSRLMSCLVPAATAECVRGRCGYHRVAGLLWSHCALMCVCVSADAPVQGARAGRQHERRCETARAARARGLLTCGCTYLATWVPPTNCMPRRKPNNRRPVLACVGRFDRTQIKHQRARTNTSQAPNNRVVFFVMHQSAARRRSEKFSRFKTSKKVDLSSQSYRQ